jgi:hypothetical protein
MKTIKITNYSCKSPGKQDINLLLSCRTASGLHGTFKQQNPFQNYLLKPNSIHSVATQGGIVIGYSIAKIWATEKIFDLDWTKSYQSDLNGDTITICEIVVANKAKGLNLGHQLLKSGVQYRNEMFDNTVKNMEMSILSTNSASERMFSKFCREFGSNLTIGVVNERYC